MLEAGRNKITDFTRDRILTLPNLIVFILNYIKKSLQLEVYNFTDRLSLSEVTKQAFSKARIKLSPIVFTLLNQKFITEYYSDNTIKTFKGLRIIATDGSTLRLPKEKQLYEIYGCNTENNGVPLAKISIIFDVLNNITLDSGIKKYLSSERAMANDHIEQLIKYDQIIAEKKCYQNDLLMFDRGYQSIFLMYYILYLKKHFLMRVTEDFLQEIKEFINSESNDGIISINAFSKGRKISKDFEKYLPDIEKLPIQVRILLFTLSSGEKEVVITSLTDINQFSDEDIFELYHMRWGVEEEYKYYKVITELENFSGKTPISVEQDFFATVLASNIHMMLSNEAENELKIEKKDFKYKYEYKINRNILVGVIKNEIIDILLGDCDLELYCANLKKRIKKNIIYVRPNRTFPRVPKRIRYKVNRRAI